VTVVSVVLVMFGFLTLSNKRSLSAGREYAMSSLYNIDHTIIINTFVPSPSLCSISRPCLAEHITTEMSRRDKTKALMMDRQLNYIYNTRIFIFIVLAMRSVHGDEGLVDGNVMQRIGWSTHRRRSPLTIH